MQRVIYIYKRKVIEEVKLEITGDSSKSTSTRELELLIICNWI